jgi:hypothetical protein
MVGVAAECAVQHAKSSHTAVSKSSQTAMCGNARDLLELIFPQRKANAPDLARHPSEDND